MLAPSQGPSRYRVDGASAEGTLKVSPSSPPVRSDSCDASDRKADATASVIIAKKIALTRRLNRPVTSESTSDTASAAATPSATAPQLGPSRVQAIATPYAPMPKNIVCAKLTMPV